MPFNFERLGIPEVILIQPRVVGDARGFFMETYKRSEFAAAGINDVFVQENHSSSEGGVLRGLHFQRPPHAQGKLVRVLSGRVFDVAVDLRLDSPTLGGWVGVSLSSTDRKLLYIPSWCAHGFCVLSDRADVVYLTSAEYAPDHESGIMWNDPALDIAWPVESPRVSERDQKWPALRLPHATPGRISGDLPGAHHG
jgi:dTDP-4-dehydrorhamnose 3,5-epimerase